MFVFWVLNYLFIFVVSFFILRFLDLVVLIFLVLRDKFGFFDLLVIGWVLIVGVWVGGGVVVGVGVGMGVGVGLVCFFGCFIEKKLLILGDGVFFDFWEVLLVVVVVIFLVIFLVRSWW